MTPEKVVKVINRYRAHLDELNIKEVEYNHEATGEPSREAIIGHCLSMFNQMLKFVEEGKMEKVFRWLGWIQCSLWVTGIYSIDDMKNDNRDPKEVEADKSSD